MTTLLLALACGGSTESERPLGESGGSAASGGPSGAPAGSGGRGAEPPSAGGTGTGAVGGTSATSGGVGTAGEVTAGSSPSGGTDPRGGSAGNGGLAGSAGSGGSGGSEAYLPRTGPFDVLVYSLTKAYKHASIPAGQEMLMAIGQKQGFNVTIAQDDSEITPEGLAKYELVFFLNATGDIFPGEDQRRAYEEWVADNGAYAGVHAAAEVGYGWAFYSELIGQNAGPHDPCCFEAPVQWTVDGAAHIAAKGLPSPWKRAEEWLTFDKYTVWSTKAGFKLLSMVTTTTSGIRPVSYVREWGNFRSFYTSLGHESATYKDPEFIKHVTAGIMWAVRREALIKE